MTQKSIQTRAANSVLPDELRQRLQRLRLYGVVKHWKDIDNLFVVTNIVDAEELDRKQRSLDRRMRSSRIGKVKHLADFDWSWPVSIDREAIEDIFRLEFIDQASNVILIGPNGIGKTMIAQNLAHAAVQAGKSAIFVNAAELMNDLKRQDSASLLARRLAHYAKPDLLVIDEVGYLAAGDRDGDLFFQLISKRYEQRSTIITTNKVFEEWNSVFPNSACTITLIDRLVHRAEIIVLDGKSYRLKEAQERKDAKSKSKKPSANPKSNSETTSTSQQT